MVIKIKPKGSIEWSPNKNNFPNDQPKCPRLKKYLGNHFRNPNRMDRGFVPSPADICGIWSAIFWQIYFGFCSVNYKNSEITKTNPKEWNPEKMFAFNLFSNVYKVFSEITVIFPEETNKRCFTWTLLNNQKRTKHYALSVSG